MRLVLGIQPQVMIDMNSAIAYEDDGEQRSIISFLFIL